MPGRSPILELADSLISMVYPLKLLLQRLTREEPVVSVRTRLRFSKQAMKILALIIHSIFSVTKYKPYKPYSLALLFIYPKDVAL